MLERLCKLDQVDLRCASCCLSLFLVSTTACVAKLALPVVQREFRRCLAAPDAAHHILFVYLCAVLRRSHVDRETAEAAESQPTRQFRSEMAPHDDAGPASIKANVEDLSHSVDLAGKRVFVRVRHTHDVVAQWLAASSVVLLRQRGLVV